MDLIPEEELETEQDSDSPSLLVPKSVQLIKEVESLKEEVMDMEVIKTDTYNIPIYGRVSPIPRTPSPTPSFLKVEPYIKDLREWESPRNLKVTDIINHFEKMTKSTEDISGVGSNSRMDSRSSGIVSDVGSDEQDSEGIDSSRTPTPRGTQTPSRSSTPTPLQESSSNKDEEDTEVGSVIIEEDEISYGPELILSSKTEEDSFDYDQFLENSEEEEVSSSSPSYSWTTLIFRTIISLFLFTTGALGGLLLFYGEELEIITGETRGLISFFLQNYEPSSIINSINESSELLISYIPDVGVVNVSLLYEKVNFLMDEDYEILDWEILRGLNESLMLPQLVGVTCLLHFLGSWIILRSRSSSNNERGSYLLTHLFLGFLQPSVYLLITRKIHKNSPHPHDIYNEDLRMNNEDYKEVHVSGSGKLPILSLSLLQIWHILTTFVIPLSFILDFEDDDEEAAVYQSWHVILPYLYLILGMLPQLVGFMVFKGLLRY